MPSSILAAKIQFDLVLIILNLFFIIPRMLLRRLYSARELVILLTRSNLPWLNDATDRDRRRRTTERSKCWWWWTARGQESVVVVSGVTGNRGNLVSRSIWKSAFFVLLMESAGNSLNIYLPKLFSFDLILGMSSQPSTRVGAEVERIKWPGLMQSHNLRRRFLSVIYFFSFP